MWRFANYTAGKADKNDTEFTEINLSRISVWFNTCKGRYIGSMRLVKALTSYVFRPARLNVVY